MFHCSWADGDQIDFDQLEEKQQKIRKPENRSKFAEEYQNDLIPIFNAEKLDFSNVEIQKDIYKSFFDQSGTIIVKNVYSSDLMDSYNGWVGLSHIFCHQLKFSSRSELLVKSKILIKKT